MSCEKLSAMCRSQGAGSSYCECDTIRRITDAGLRTIASKRGAVVLTGEQRQLVLYSLERLKDSPLVHGISAHTEAIDAAIRELEGAR